MVDFNVNKLAHKAISCSRKAFEALTNPDRSTNFPAASGYIGCACSYLNSARSLYFASHNSDEDNPTCIFFDTFDVYINEVLKAIDTGSLIYLDEDFTNLLYAYENSELRNTKQP
ncbi:MAG: hypothetical protein K2H82_00850 [Oscillospiraceae bacterium]|nr:hypothetical protein [Oscillospiraceae bacterium]